VVVFVFLAFIRPNWAGLLLLLLGLNRGVFFILSPSGRLGHDWPAPSAVLAFRACLDRCGLFLCGRVGK
jgi:hypothetical protein